MAGDLLTEGAEGSELLFADVLALVDRDDHGGVHRDGEVGKRAEPLGQLDRGIGRRRVRGRAPEGGADLQAAERQAPFHR